MQLLCNNFVRDIPDTGLFLLILFFSITIFIKSFRLKWYLDSERQSTWPTTHHGPISSYTVKNFAFK